jgi:IclR family transcriptional regulator, pca regulon regulatory protein
MEYPKANAKHVLNMTTDPAIEGDGRNGSGEGYLVNSLVRGLQLLEEFTRERGSLSLPEIAERRGLNRTTAYRFIYTLRHLGYVELEPDTRRYRLGPKVLQLGFEFLHSQPLVTIAEPLLRELRDETGESAHLGVLDGDSVVYLVRVPSEGVFSASVRVGARLPAHTTSMGRVLLAFLPPQRAEKLLADVGIFARPNRRAAAHDAFFARLEQVRLDGYIVSEQEYEVGVSSVAAPIRDASGEVIAAINASGPSARMTREVIDSRVVPAVQSFAQRPSTLLGLQPAR